MTKNKLLLVDGNSVAFRAFFALHNSLERFKKQQWAAHKCDLCLSYDV